MLSGLERKQPATVPQKVKSCNTKAGYYQQNTALKQEDEIRIEDGPPLNVAAVTPIAHKSVMRHKDSYVRRIVR
jgi:hypothetical protein